MRGRKTKRRAGKEGRIQAGHQPGSRCPVLAYHHSYPVLLEHILCCEASQWIVPGFDGSVGMAWG